MECYGGFRGTDVLSVAKSYNSTLNSSIPTGAVWDRTLGWIYETGNKTLSELVIDSKSWGNYHDDIYTSPFSEMYNTGSMSHTVANNIYDLAGNLFELTTEETMANGIHSVYRGGDYSWNGYTCPAASRTCTDGESTYYVGFRIVLYK